jgi:hypothetical protein
MVDRNIYQESRPEQNLQNSDYSRRKYSRVRLGFVDLHTSNRGVSELKYRHSTKHILKFVEGDHETPVDYGPQSPGPLKMRPLFLIPFGK